MAATVRTLLENALYLSKSDRDFSPVEASGSEINVALDVFIDVLDVYRDEVPYFTERTLDGEAELLNIDASSINFVNYVLGNVTYSMAARSQLEFSRINTVINLRAIPTDYWLDEANNELRVYPLPQNATDKFIIGYLPILTATNLDQKLPPAITKFMKLFFQYEVAAMLCDIYTIPWSQQKEKSRMRYYGKLIENMQNEISLPDKPRLMNNGFPVPWLAYISGNTPAG